MNGLNGFYSHWVVANARNLQTGGFFDVLVFTRRCFVEKCKASSATSMEIYVHDCSSKRIPKLVISTKGAGKITEVSEVSEVFTTLWSLWSLSDTKTWSNSRIPCTPWHNTRETCRKVRAYGLIVRGSTRLPTRRLAREKLDEQGKFRNTNCWKLGVAGAGIRESHKLISLIQFHLSDSLWAKTAYDLQGLHCALLRTTHPVERNSQTWDAEKRCRIFITFQTILL